MAHLTSRQIQQLARRPADMARYMATGRAPQEREAPRSPLIELLEALPPRDLGQIRGLSVGPELGYSGQRQFASAAQALMWLKPPHAGESHPAESWRDKRFNSKLWLDDLLPHASSAPEGLAARAARLMDPARRVAPASAAAEPAREAPPSSPAGPKAP